MTQVRQRQFMPADQPTRTGPTQILGLEHYDTPFYGYGQAWDNQNGVELFTDQVRCRNKDLCSLTEPGKLSDDKEFHSYAFAMQVEFLNPDLYEIFVYYSRIELWKQDSLKNRIWTSRIGSGGGVSGGDVNTGAYHLSNGWPVSNNIYRSAIPWIFPPGKTWKLIMRFMQLFNGTTPAAAALQPTTIFNADVGTEEQIRKLVRFLMWGIEFRDTTNG